MQEDRMLERPRVVTIAVYMLYFSLGLAVIEMLLQRGAIGSLKPVDWATLLTLGLIYYKIGKGRNWARVTNLILVLLGLPLSILSVILRADRWVVAEPLSINLAHIEIVQGAIQLGAVVVLFLRSSSDWFKAIKNIEREAADEQERALAQVSSIEKTDIENLVDSIKKELAHGTRKCRVIKILEKDGWDKKEATQFVRQIALELTTNPKYLPLITKRYKKYLLEGAALATIGMIAVGAGIAKVQTGASLFLLGGITALWGLVGWWVYQGRLKFGECEPMNRADTFRPTKGGLHFTIQARSDVKAEIIGLCSLIIICVLVIMILLDRFFDLNQFID